MTMKRALLKGWVVAALSLGLSTPALAQTQYVNSRETTLQQNTHALGLSGSTIMGANGVQYRRYFGNNFVQVTALFRMNRSSAQAPIEYDLWGTLSAGRYLLTVQRPGLSSWWTGSFSMRALGLVGGGIAQTVSQNFDTSTHTTRQTNEKWVGAGIGFEVGGVSTAGVSLTTDLYLASHWDEVGFSSLTPHAQFSLVFSW